MNAKKISLGDSILIEVQEDSPVLPATIFIKKNPRSSLLVMSDSLYGSYSYRFADYPVGYLKTLAFDSAMDKLTNGRYTEPDFEAQKEFLEKRVQAAVDSGSLSERDGVIVKQELTRIIINKLPSIDRIYDELKKSNFLHILNGDIPAHTKPTTDAQLFWERVWQPAMELI